jgi:hypothetical protein
MQAISAHPDNAKSPLVATHHAKIHGDKKSEVDRSHAITSRIVEHDFPVEFVLAGELAQMETFAIPRISKLLHRTRQYEDDGVKRLDDTKATLYEIFTQPAGHEAREKMVSHLNWVHSHYDIDNDDNIYTLIRMFLNPIEWIEKWGRRPLSSSEKQALADELNVIAQQMNIRDMPKTIEAMDHWQQDYRAENERFHADNAAVAGGMMQAIELHFPKLLRHLVKPTILALLDNDPLLVALGYTPPSRISKVLVKGGLASWRLASRIYNPWAHKRFSDGWFVNYYPSYADDHDGFSLCKVGPKKLLAARDKKASGCPFH